MVRTGLQMRILLSSILVLMVCFLGFSQPLGKCTTLTTSKQLGYNITCFGIVDYEYFLPDSVTEDDLNSKASSQLSDIRFSILPVKCLASLKKSVCANIYYKCPKDFNALNLTTHDHSIFHDIGASYPIPFQRPCLNICNDVNRDCLGLMNIFGKKTNCLERYDYSNMGYGKSISNTSYSYPFPYTYDQSNGSKCNNMPVIVTVAAGMEPYIFAETGVCAGILTSVYVPTGPVLTLALAPMQSPYVVQSAIEKKILSGNLSRIISHCFVYTYVYI